jgi:hypothetical protein
LDDNDVVEVADESGGGGRRHMYIQCYRLWGRVGKEKKRGWRRS